MKNIFKKVGAGLLSVALVVGAGATLVGCGKKDPDPENQVLSLSVNPGVEFIVDNDDKVLSVTASNEDGAYLLEKFTDFTGMSAKDAALKFLELSEQYGFVVEGTTNGETFTISVSGDGANDLYNDVKNKINNKATELGLTIGAMDKITEEELEAIVAECYQEYSAEAIDDLDDEELLNLIKQSREETKDLKTEEERLAYYKDRALKVIETKINAINEYLDEDATLEEKIKAQADSILLNEIYPTIVGFYDLVEGQLNELNGLIDEQLNSYISQKEEYLALVEEYREALALNSDSDPSNDVDAVELTELTTLKQQADTVKAQIETFRTQAKAQISSILETYVYPSLQTINGYINSILSDIDLSISEINNQVQTQITTLKTEHALNSTNPWGN